MGESLLHDQWGDSVIKTPEHRLLEELGARGEDVDAEWEAQRIPDGVDEAIDKDRRGRLTAPGWQEV